MNASHVLGNVAATVTAVGLNSLWEDALVVACVWVFLRTWPRVNAATRYVIWSVALLAAVVVPVATTLPFLSMSPPAAATAAVRASIVPAMHAFPAIAARGGVREVASHDIPAHEGIAAPRALPRVHLQLPMVVAIVLASLWALLALGGAIRFGAGLLRLERLKRDALPLPVEYRDAMLRWNAATKGVRDVRLCVSDQIDVPVAVGLFDSMILIPRDLLQRLSADEVDQIALHELAHLRRADDWTNGLARILLAAFGWNPAVRFAAAQLDLEREVACDDYVLDASGVVRSYAMCLAKMAESSSWPRSPIAAPAVFATRKHLSLRIERLLFAGRAAGTNPSFGIAAFAVAGVVLLGCAIGSIAPSVAATVQPAALPAPVEAHRVQAVRDIVRYVNIPRTIVAVATPVPSPQPSATTRPLATAHAAATAHPQATTHAFASLAPIAPIHLHAMVSPRPLASGTMAIHIPAIDVPSLHIAPINVTIPKIGLANGGKVCTGCDYSGVDWRGRDVRGVAYTGVDLRRANLDGTDFSGGSFQGVDFSHARLRNASFRDARLTGCDFTGADLSGADFTGAHVSGCQFDHAQLVSARVRTIVTGCEGCDFAGANLGGVDLSNVRGADIDFAGADLSHANLSGSSFTDVDFAGARMAGANIDGAVFTNCDLSGTNLTRAALARAKLIDTDYPDDR